MGPLVSVVPVVVTEEALVWVVAGMASVVEAVLTVVSPVVALASEESAVSPVAMAALEAADVVASG